MSESRKKKRDPDRELRGWDPVMLVVPKVELAAWRRAAELAGLSLRDFVRAKLAC